VILAALSLLVLGTGASPDAAPPGEPPPVVVSVERDRATNVVVTVHGCGDLDAVEVARVLDLELRSVTAEIRSGPPLSVRLECASDRLSIAVEDPITRKELRRDVPAPPREPGRERIVALAVSALFNASWLELLATPPEAPAIPVEPPQSPEPAVAAAETIARTRTQPVRGLELLAGAGVRGRSLESGEPFAAGRIDLGVRGFPSESLGLAAQIGWDFGQATRGFGRVRGHAIGAAGGLAWRVRPRPGPRSIMAVGGGLLVGVAWARLSGIAAEPGVATGRTSGVTGDLVASIGPRVMRGRLRIDLDGEVGVMLRSPRGVVAGEPDVSMGGVWVGAALRVGAELARPRRRPAPR
jgi:hypothetical protein